FNGQCEEAFKFYEEVLGGKITFMMTWGEAPDPDQCPSETHKLIMPKAQALGCESRNAMKPRQGRKRSGLSLSAAPPGASSSFRWLRPGRESFARYAGFFNMVTRYATTALEPAECRDR